MLAMNPSLEYIAALFGIMQLGAIPVPCFPPVRAKDVGRFHAIAMDCSPHGVVVDAMYSGTACTFRSRTDDYLCRRCTGRGHGCRHVSRSAQTTLR